MIWKTPESETATKIPARRKTETATRKERAAVTHKIEGKSLVVMQVNCRSIYNMSLDFWNLIDTYDPAVVIGKESWLREEISNAEIFRADYTTFRRDRHARSGGVFICVKNYIACAELWVDEEFEMIAVEVKRRYSKCIWGNCRHLQTSK
jgi:hypothetical protein